MLHTRVLYLPRAGVDSLPHPSKLDMREACRQELCERSTGIPTRHLQNRVRCQVKIKLRYRFAFTVLLLRLLASIHSILAMLGMRLNQPFPINQVEIS